jgi:uncharacterized membrane protein
VKGEIMKKLQAFAMKTMNGMTYGLFSTLIVGVIIDQIGKLLGLTFLTNPIYYTLSLLMGAGIGLGIGIALKFEGIKLVTTAIVGGIATSFRVTFANGIQVANIDGPTAVYNEPLTVYFVVITTLLLMQVILKKKTPVDILLIPLTAVILATLSTFVYSAPLFAFIEAIKSFINTATTVAPLPMSIIIAVSMGMLLTSPLSSAAIAITIQLSGIAGGAAVVGTMIQMIGFSFQSRKDNSLGMVLSIGFGTSMLQFKNILRKPVIWIPTIVASAVLAPILVLLFKIETTAYGAGMGTAGLVGPLQTLFEMNYSINAFLSMVIILFGGVALVYVFDLLLRKLGLIVKGDFNVLNDIV